jgi:hypothetical protein
MTIEEQYRLKRSAMNPWNLWMSLARQSAMRFELTFVRIRHGLHT